MYNIGIDIGGSKIAFGIVDEDGNIVYKDQIKNSGDISAEDEIKNIAEVLEKLMGQYNLKYSDINSIGIGFPGPVNKKGIVVGTNVSINNMNLAEELGKFIKLPIYVENDANCAVVGEYVHGSLKEAKDVAFVTLGTGVGGGLIIDGKLYVGADGGAAEFGHQVIVMNGKRCGCGRCGCLESYASTKAWEDRIREKLEKNKDSKIYELTGGNPENVNGKVIFQAIDANDEFAMESYREHLKYIALGINNLIAIFQPEIIAISGGITGVGEKLLNPLIAEIKEEMKDCKINIKNTEIKIAELGNDAGIIGAAEIYRFK
ncbi:MAG: hypothetical protein A2Y24_04315 [Clostridiales bacterium GWE2_32_10]|nr:MAG: hypothetical protein A2Y24_04315 [Clostridiales bacterium GWE2_32_10]HBY20203.1 glucokinase [Clostridiales bacterium]